MTSFLAAVVVTAHLAVATAFIATMTWATVLAFRREPARSRTAPPPAGSA
ncbi:MAG: hypothetical protein LN410_02885 [Candidatus Thermoplasmatota archaeon]|nr:hypothetical protein [Candidatus Thermoplasmatota archaeon]